jgi:hypothetical protein
MKKITIWRYSMAGGAGLPLCAGRFGTGYSSLSRLRRFPISRLKIDRSFVRTLPGNTDDEAVVRATLSMARDMGMDVVAEGVETQAQSDCLLALGCKRDARLSLPDAGEQLLDFVQNLQQGRRPALSLSWRSILMAHARACPVGCHKMAGMSVCCFLEKYW